jgi:hypothetical protein
MVMSEETYRPGRRSIHNASPGQQKMLDLRGGELTAPPPEIGQLAALTSLDLSDDGLAEELDLCNTF